MTGDSYSNSCALSCQGTSDSDHLKSENVGSDPVLGCKYIFFSVLLCHVQLLVW